MPKPSASHHVYQRSINSFDSNDSLSIIAKHILPGQTVLDLGMGSGTLGRHLTKHHDQISDGVTLNQDEADIACQWYRKVFVTDLDTADLAALFNNQQYDCIVCADVLEHLKAPERLLDQCSALLKPQGRLFTSIPNAGYCGLIAELIEGEFRYRPEGLLDRTHLRFFTRKSMQRFFSEHGWSTLRLETTQRDLLESEFKVAFDSLPPAVARHLLALTDAQTYQFIAVLQPTKLLPSSYSSLPDSSTKKARFSTQLYLTTHSSSDEDLKLVTAGEIGTPLQLLVFEIPASLENYTSIRLDPADRPGFFHLYHLKLRLPSGAILWQWQAVHDDVSVLSGSIHNDILFQQPWALVNGIMLLLFSDDPWLQLPLLPEILKAISQSGARLEISSGWPMSADYLQASSTIGELQSQRLHMQQKCDQIEASNRTLEQDITAAKLQLEKKETALKNVKLANLRIADELDFTKLETKEWRANFEQLQSHLQTIEQSTVFRITRPLVHLKMQFDSLLKRNTASRPSTQALQDAQPQTLPEHPVDIIVPVYRGFDDTRRCIESVLNATVKTKWRLVVINDSSPQPEITDWLRTISTDDRRVELIENSENLGFVASVNRGMTLSTLDDVLLLNSDTEVANDWLDRIQRAAYSRPKVGSVTPFSNNATICSYPRFCDPNTLPYGHDTASLDRLFAQHLSGQTLPIPTGVGFCMYIRRQCLDEVGLFDVKNFGKGYGEENDFCVRAGQSGWTHLHALDTFVSHSGGISFGDSKNDREFQAIKTLNRLHPKYTSDVQRYAGQDPARSARMLINIARIVGIGKPVILTVTHDRDGGTLRHIQELAHFLSDQAIFLRLWPVHGGVAIKLEGPSENFQLHFAIPKEYDKLLRALQLLQVSHVHFHHLLGLNESIAELPTKLNVTHDFTAHDYYSYCPQISLTDRSDRYCGEQGLEQCRQCLQNTPAPDGSSIEVWRHRYASMLSTARYLITPSQDCAHRISQFVPAARIRVVPHTALSENPPVYPTPNPKRLSSTKTLKIMVLGALSKIKGADVLEAVATLAAAKNAPIEFHLIGYSYRALRTQPKAHLTVHGSYDDSDLPKIIQWLQPDLVWFPAQWPETYSYTLSACLENGLPVVAPNLGAFAERVKGRRWTWLTDWNQSAGDSLDFFEKIRSKNFLTGVSPAPTYLIDEIELTENESFHYRKEYLKVRRFDTKITKTTEELNSLKKEIESNYGFDKPILPVKSITLKLVVLLRSNMHLSTLAKIIPVNTQRRVKTWLRK